MSLKYASASEPAGRVPALWNVPFARNKYFCGREDEIADLRNSMSSPESGRHVQAIWGLAGVGKTQLALEYCYRYQGEYEIVWWLSADEPSNLALGFARLATRLGMEVPEGTPLEDIRLALRKHLAKRTDWLLIFDNAAAVDDVRPYIPTERTGHVIVTSRNPNWESVGRPFPLRPMKRVEAVDFLLKRTGRKSSDSVGMLAQALGDLPLALEQAGACITQTRADFPAYLRQFETHWAELLKDVRPTGDYPDSVQMTWEIACRHMQEEAPKATRLMNVLAFLGAEAVPREMLIGVKDLPEEIEDLAANPADLDDAVKTLCSYSLIRDDGTRMSMHRLVGNLVRDRMPQGERRQWAEAVIRLVSATFRFDSQDLGTWERCAALLPHALAAAWHAEASRAAPRATITVLDDAGRYLTKRAQFEEAKGLFERALAIASNFYGLDHPRVSALANNLGRVHRQLGNIEEAKSCFERALDIDRNAYGDGDPHMAAVFNNYGVALHETGQKDEARKSFEWALQVFETHYGPSHATVASVVNNLGYVLKGEGDLEGGRQHFERAMTIAKEKFGPRHPVVASILTNLGIVQRLAGDVAAAKTSFEQALEIHEAVHGESHPSVSRDAAHLGVALQELGLHKVAMDQFERALKIDRAVFGENHVSVAFRLTQMGRLLQEMDNNSGAERCFKRAKAIREVIAAAKSA